MSINFNFNPYFDDFETPGGPRDSNYMRVLFKPSLAVQARELTQLQSIIQNQIKQFGDHIFKDGSPVTGGQLTLDTKVKSIKLNPQFGFEDIFVSDFLNQLIVNQTGAASKRAIVVAADDTQEFPTLLVRYLRGVEFVDGEEIRVATSAVTRASLIASDAQTVGSAVSMNEGVFYVNGFFVYVPPQTIVLDPYSKKPNFRIGLEIDETIVDFSQDSSLLDPAQGSFNFQAPGADRYQYSLLLSKRTLDSEDDSRFFELLRVENGIITKQVKYPIYSELEKTLARRTFDESGNYTVTAFRASPVENNTDPEKFDIEIEAGKAYVQGFEFETVGVTKITADRAREISNVQDYDLSLEYGNYVTVNNLFSGNVGIFDTKNYSTADLHIVPSALINTSSSDVYARTVAGNTRVRNIQRAGDDRYFLYLVNVNVQPITVNAASTAVNSNSIPLPSDFSSVDQAYVNTEISIIAGTNSGERRRVVTYNGLNKVIFVDRPFSAPIEPNSVVSFNFGIKDVESITVKPTTFAANVFGTKNTQTAIFACADIDPSSRTIAGNTFIERTNFNTLIFPLPEKFIEKTSINNADYFHRKLLNNMTFDVSGNLTIGTGSFLTTGETFFYGSDGSTLSPTAANNNILVLVRDKLSSNASNGQIINLTRSGSGVLRVTDSQIEIISGINDTFTADVFINVKVNDSEQNYTRTKTLVGNTNTTSLIATSAAATSVIGQSNTKIDTTNGIVWFTDTNDIQKIPGSSQSLFVPDVVRLVKVFDSGNPAFEPNNTNRIDVTGNYTLDTGQRDNYYDHASIRLRRNAAAPKGQTAVVVQYYSHSATEGYFSANSYPTDVYNNNIITVYSSESVSTVSLRDVVDFRPTRTIGTISNVNNFNLNGLKIPFTELSMELNYGFYLPRIDKIIATPDREFKIIKGISTKFPQIPEDSQLGMTLYTIYVPPFTSRVKDVKLQFVENRRYTMKDIGKIEKRVENVEILSQLNLSEIEALRDLFLYEDGVTEKEKYGVLVDSFDGFNIADNKNPDLLCHISNKKLKPYKIFTSVPLKEFNVSGPVRKNNKTYSLQFTEERTIVQSTATKAISVQPYLFASFAGELKLNPDLDTWVSLEIAPEVVTPDPIINERPPTEPSPVPTVVTTITEPPPPIEFTSGGFFFTGINTFGFEANWVDIAFSPPLITSIVSDIVDNQTAPRNIELGGSDWGLTGIEFDPSLFNIWW